MFYFCHYQLGSAKRPWAAQQGATQVAYSRRCPRQIIVLDQTIGWPATIRRSQLLEPTKVAKFDPLRNLSSAKRRQNPL